MATQKFTSFGNFLFYMHADMTAITIHSNKIVSNDVKKQLSATRAMAWKKPNELFGQPHNCKDRGQVYIPVGLGIKHRVWPRAGFDSAVEHMVDP